MSDEQDQQFVEYVLKTIVDNPDDVNVDRTIDEMGVLISVSVNPDDMGKVIGKSGQTAKAIRTLLKVVGAKHDARVNMKIIEPEGSSMAAEEAPADSGAAGEETPAGGPPPADDAEEAATPAPEGSAESEAAGEEGSDEPAPAAEKKDDSLSEKSPLDDL